MKKAVIIGASSRIGRELARLLSQHDYQVCATARRLDLLQTLLPELANGSIIRQMDVADGDEVGKLWESILSTWGPVDLVIIAAGTGHLNPELEWTKEQQTIQTNVVGFTRLAGLACQHFETQKQGHLVVLSSLAALRGAGMATSYNASKAYVSNYLEGLRQKYAKVPDAINITDVRPGFVDTDMAKGEGLFWVQPVPKAAHQIYQAILRKRKVVYVTKRWKWIALLLRLLPESLYNKM